MKIKERCEDLGGKELLTTVQDIFSHWIERLSKRVVIFVLTTRFECNLAFKKGAIYLLKSQRK